MANITTLEFEGFYYIQAGDIFAKGCRRCGGTGHYSFNGFDSICYLCNNVWEGRIGDIFPNEAAAQKWCHERAVRKAQADRKREAARLVEVQALADKVATVPADVREFLLQVELNEYDGEMDYYGSNRNENYERDAFIRNMAEQLQFVVNARRPFTEKMVEAVRSNIAKRAQREAELVPAPEGRVTVTGEIVGTKVVEGDYGTAYKVTVKDDRGFRVYVSLPKAQADQAFDEYYEALEAAGKSRYDFGPACWFLGADGTDEQGVKGRRITFDAALERSRDDASFAFGKRPTKGSWI
ncbi:hypothetical protein SEA_REDFIELD_30 [Microbacterium phage Redfield]|uniref:Uncharacterized protein n=5 Tax=Ilzatvirus hamlet TaxID=2560591 RepID=A0A345MEJ9_9CAUD|nr:hypothetical protein FDJ35_gp30 [Microbacterium phage Hamlet]AUX83556.1 hypothetical protein PBI_BALSA_30 [Microbacterium phage Balsa]AVR56116.1 hypothetical protein PBI_BEEBEE8_31 [Microbacterium phage BeeBee8]AXH46420.1 hypothetical protein SEA_REDFIELD_30 [Microbacterium phage Redfield]AXH68980.1 hypothetical protein SCHNAPSIDEE_30 [Microbacterium phage Schnapsidee]AUX82866.1 hypothetical protein PBI_HAMLET_30 [Microbacterium phage Hamlet]